MTTMDVGDRVNVQYLAYAAGVASTATVALTVTAPDGTPSTPSVTLTSPNIYNASFTLTSAGTWSWVWNVSGLVVDVERGSVLAANPAPITYASLADLKTYMRITDTTEDSILTDALASASRWITNFCGRTFGQATTATMRTFPPMSHCVAKVDDFWTTSGLVIAVATSSTTFGTAWATTDYELDPADGIVDGEPGWPFWSIRALNQSFPCWFPHRSVQVTAKWGWPSVPDPVRRACIQVAEEDFKMKGAPFGVASMDQFGPIRVRDNPKVVSWLGPYCKYPVLVG